MENKNRFEMIGGRECFQRRQIKLIFLLLWRGRGRGSRSAHWPPCTVSFHVEEGLVLGVIEAKELFHVNVLLRQLE
jgi:hypothetical protein